MKLHHWVLAAAAVLFLWWLGGHDLWAPDEPYFAEGAREMVVDGRWAVPHVNGVVTTDKPPLFFWMIALFSLPLGQVTEWTARLPSVLAALGTVALLLSVGRRRFGPRTAALAGVLLATTHLFWDKARWSQTDSLLCFLIWAALAAFEATRAGELRGRVAGVVFWTAAALAVLTKGPVGLLLPLGVCLATLAVDRRLGSWRRFAPLIGPLVFAGIVGAWMGWATVAGGGEYSVWGALREHFVERGIHGMHHRQPPWYYLQTLPVSLLPWTGLVPGALLLAWRRRAPVDRFLLVAALFPVLFFSISTEKRDLYVLPALPAFALLAAALVAAVCGWNEAKGDDARVRTGWVLGGQGAIGGVLAVAGSALFVPTVVERAMAEAPVTAALVGALGAALAATGVATGAFAARRRPLGTVGATATGIAFVYLLVVTWVYPALEGRKSARPFTERIAQETRAARAEGWTIVTHGLGNLPEAVAFYGDGLYTVEEPALRQVEEHLTGPGPAWAVVDGATWERLEEVRVEAEVVATDRLARRDVVLVRGRSGEEGISNR